MENNYDVGIANRFALFLEEGDSSLTAIKKKFSKELRAKNKQERKENAENRKAEAVKPIEKPKKPEPKPVVEETTPLKKEVKESKNEVAKGKEKKQNDIGANKRDKEPQDKPRNVKNGETALVEVENWYTELAKPIESAAPAPRKNFENRKPRERKYDGNDQYQPKNYSNQKRFNKDDSVKNEAAAGDVTFDRYQNDDGSVRENGHGPQGEYRPRGGPGRFRGNNRGGRNNYGGGDRRREYNNEQRFEPKDEGDKTKNDTWGDEKAETPIENPDNQCEEAKTDNDGSTTNEQKEEVEQMTLDEWKKIRGERVKPQYNVRLAGEGEDLSQWKNMRELPKKEEPEFLENGYNNSNTSKKNDSEKENSGNENVQRAPRHKLIDINIHFREPSTRGRGSRITRHNRSGYKGRNDDRNDRNDSYGGETRSFRKTREGPPSGRGNHRQNAPKMDDEHAFPSLG